MPRGLKQKPAVKHLMKPVLVEAWKWFSNQMKQAEQEIENAERELDSLGGIDPSGPPSMFDAARRARACSAYLRVIQGRVKRITALRAWYNTVAVEYGPHARVTFEDADKLRTCVVETTVGRFTR